MLPDGVLELRLTFIADGKAITWHEVLDATILALLHCQWKRFEDWLLG